MKTDALKNLNTITTIPTQTIRKLFDKLSWVSCEAVEESVLSGDNFAEIDIGIGVVIIQITDDEILYKFVPNRSFESNIRETVVNKKNPMVDILEKTFAERFIKTYKDLF